MEKENENKKSNLEDIMIDNGDGQKQLKKILMMVALVIVILIVAIAATKIIIGGDDKKESAANKPPVNAPTPAVKDEKEPLFEEVPMETNKDADAELEKMITQLRDSEKRQQELEKIEQQETVEQEAVTKQEVPEKEVVQPEPKKEQETKIAQPQPKPQKRAPVTEKYDPYKVANGWYVQVGSFSKFAPNQGFLNSIKEKGYKYYFYRTQVNGIQMTKVIVGPYETKKEVDAQKLIIRKEIKEGAFSFKVSDAD